VPVVPLLHIRPVLDEEGGDGQVASVDGQQEGSTAPLLHT
jgi:hypothetical protein